MVLGRCTDHSTYSITRHLLITCYYNLSNEVKLQRDTSKVGLGPEWAFHSQQLQTLTPAEMWYAQVEKELGEGTQKSVIRGGSAPGSNPLPFYIPFFQDRHPFRIPFIGKRHPLHNLLKMTYIKRGSLLVIFFHVARNKLKWNSHKLRLLDLF